jgi:hypothetical protein
MPQDILVLADMLLDLPQTVIAGEFDGIGVFPLFEGDVVFEGD